MTIATHHLHKRKRIYKRKEPYPAQSRWKRFLDKFIYVIGVIGPLSTIPQILKIWLEKSAESVSLLTWILYLVGAFVLLLYAISHREKPLIIMYALWILVDLLIIIGIMIY